MTDDVIVQDGLVLRPLDERVDAFVVEMVVDSVNVIVTRNFDKIGHYLGVYLGNTQGLSAHTTGKLGKVYVKSKRIYLTRCI